MSAFTERETLWGALAAPWDLIIIGGGITGASVLREATRAGLKALLVEQRDFAWGTSSRSSKLVHGGLRYLANGDVPLVRQSIRERQRLLAEGNGLVQPLDFMLASHPREGGKHWQGRAGIFVYELLTGRWPRGNHATAQLRELEPSLVQEEGLIGVPYDEAWVDDARLVLRILREGVAAGGSALNHVRVTGLLREDGRVTGVELMDTVGQRSATVRARAVVNATGVWADSVRAHLSAAPKLRPLRGSHLVFSSQRFPLAHGISFRHPRGDRFVCVMPWEDSTLVGTTDLDHHPSLDQEPSISSEEVAYLMEAVESRFPALKLTLDDVVSCYAGVRPVISSGASDPSKESREHLVLEEEGLVTVTGGKLTTCRAIAHDALRALRRRIPELASLEPEGPFLGTPPSLDDAPLSPEARLRLRGRYGADAPALVAMARPGELDSVPGTSTLWAELRWAARNESVVHLDDLLLRRVRLGLLLPRGGEAHLSAIRTLCQQELGWDDTRWESEARAYLTLWRTHYALPEQPRLPAGGELLPAQLEKAPEKPRLRLATSQSSPVRLQTVNLQGGPVHYADYGGSGPTLVMLHGLGGCYLNWLPAAPLLTKHARVLSLDLIGFGRTPMAGRSVGVASQQQMLQHFLTEVVGGPAVLVGNSWGGLVALAHAAQAPETTAGLVLVSPAQPPPLGTRLDPVQAARLVLHTMPGVGEYIVWRDGKRSGARGLFMDLLTLGCADVRRVPQEVVEENTALLAERMERMPLGHSASYLRATRSMLLTLLGRNRFESWVRGVRAPTLLVHGRQDRLVPVASSKALAALRPDWSFEPLDDIGHVPQMEDAPRFVERMTRWMDESLYGRRPALSTGEESPQLIAGLATR
ncbi:FAD-dependent oxidoreductase [Archangium violaceum]|uniref:FAD-dependent oxidoreductase n=1 Tax=Archangium violaceum TaxID=83451 RepID=UPI002B2AE67C|nr:FAD-dependent oxidoreductase [Archangium violaceum]